MGRLTALALTIFLGGVPLAVEAAGQAAAPGTISAQVSVMAGRTTGVEARDLRTLEGAMRDMQRRGYPGLARHLQALKAALDRAPADYGIVDRSVPNRWIVRSDDFGQMTVLATMAGMVGNGQNTQILQQPNVYGTIALLLGSEAVERHAYEDAVALLDRGIAFQPENGFLVGEKASALQGLGRHDEVLVLVERAIPELGLGSAVEHALLERRRGASLVELGRLDEAKTAYEASIQILPDNPMARNELEYIRGLQAGEATRPLALVAPSSPAATD